MYLHEAISKLLKASGRSMSTKEIADELNRLDWYTKKNKSQITNFQIHGRTKNYPDLFVRQGSQVSLKGSNFDGISIHTKTTKHKSIAPSKESVNITAYENNFDILFIQENYKPAGTIDSLVDDSPGIYCIRVIDVDSLPDPFSSYLTQRGHNILYIGIATVSLKTRFLNQELRGIGHGTLFRGIGAIIGYRPEKGSLKNKRNKGNYTFSATNNKAIIAWINENLLANWITFNGNLKVIETKLIHKYRPLLNTSKNPAKLKELAILRKECCIIANENE